MLRRPRKSDVEDQMIRPAELHSDSMATKPAAAAARDAASPLPESGKKSRKIGAARSRIPMPAVTLKQSTTQSSQNCGVLIAFLADTWLRVIRTLSGFLIQPAGFQPGAGTRISP